MSVSPDVEIGLNSQIGPGVTIWSGTCLRESVKVGSGTSLGRNCYVGPGVSIGSNCSIQNHVQIFEPATIGDHVFIGPGTIVTNDVNPRATNGAGERKQAADWKRAAASILEGASLGAGVICVGDVTIGEHAMVGAGAVVIRDVSAFELVAGSPARHIGWVGSHGSRLVKDSGSTLRCPDTGDKFALINVKGIQKLKPLH